MASKPTPTPDEDTDDTYADRNSPDFWLKFIRSSKRGNPARHVRFTRDAYREYLKETFDDNTNQTEYDRNNLERVYPAYFSCVNTLEPALYSRTPDIITERRFDINDPIAETMSVITERLGTYLMENSNFDDVMTMAVADFIHGSKATNQIVYEADVDETGIADPTSQKITLAPACYDEVIHTINAKLQSDITEMAYYFCISKPEALKKFESDALAGYSWKSSPDNQPLVKDNAGTFAGDRVQNSGELYLDGWECCCKITKKFYWVSEGLPGKFLKEPVNDPYGLRNFFPSPPFILQGKPPKSMYPTPVWIHIRPTANQLHIMYERVFQLIDAVRRRAIVDGDQDIVALLNSGNLEFISARSLKNIVEKGGLENMIYYLPVQELVSAITELNSQEQLFIANLEKWMHIPDIMQGLSDPIETLGAQQIKASSASDAFRNVKKKVQQLARDSLEMMIDLAYKVFDDKKIADITGMKYMMPNDQQNFGQALSLLRNDETRVIRIGIDTDSMSFVDQGLKTQRLNAAMQTVQTGIKQAVDAIQVSPQAAGTILKTVMITLDASDIGKEFIAEVKSDVEQLIQQALQPKPPPPPPQLDPNVQAKIQSDQQINQQKLQADGQNKAADSQSRERIEMAKIQADQQYRMAQLQLEQAKLQQAGLMNKTNAILAQNEQQLEVEKFEASVENQANETALESRSLDVQEQKAENDIAIAQFEAREEAQANDFKKKIDAVSTAADIHTSFLDADAAKTSNAIDAHRAAADTVLGIHNALTPNLPPTKVGVPDKPKPPKV